MSVQRPRRARPTPTLPILASMVLVLTGLVPARAFMLSSDGSALSIGDTTHLLVSEVLAGAASASDEFIELFNPAATALPLEGLEVVYVTASGGTITRKAAWAAGAPELGSGAHLLIANEAGIYAAIADATYAGGLAGTGGSVAIRIQGASSSIDAVGWGTATNTWLEGIPAAAVAAGTSLERLLGGVNGSFQDSDDNVIDFVGRDVPDPQNSGSAPIPPPSASPSPTPSGSAAPTDTPAPTATPIPTPILTPSPTASPVVTPTPTPTPTPPTPSPTGTPQPVIAIADARALPDGTIVTIGGITLSDSAFTDGGGYLADATGGLAVMVSDGTFARGRRLVITGELDTRYQQRTLRTSAAQVSDLGAGVEVGALAVQTGSVNEGVESTLIHISGTVVSSATTLSSGVAYDVDDGSGPARVLIGSATGIDLAGWQRDASVTVTGVAGQRDASGTGTTGYRVQPRDAADVEITDPAPSTTPMPSSTPAPTATPTPGPDPGVQSIANARTAVVGARVRVRGVVTLGTGLIDPPTAVIQDSSAAILLRVGDEFGSLRRGQLVEVSGRRSTRSGMLSIQLTETPRQLGSQAEPDAGRHGTGELGEDFEAQLVAARGAVTTAPLRSSAGNVFFTIDDGSGELRVAVAAAAAADLAGVLKGSWVEVHGVLGQETTGSQPLRGYRLWPRAADDIGVVAGAGDAPVAAPSTSPAAGLTPSGHSLPIGAVARALGPDTATSGQRAVPTVGGSPSTGIGPSPAPAGGTVEIGSGSEELHPRNPLLALLVVALALAALGGIAFIGWRDGTFSRLMSAVRVRAGDASAGDGDVELERPVEPHLAAVEGMPRLSVIRVPHEPRAP